MLLEAHGVVRTFGQLRAVDGADIALAEGEILGLIGPNGAGKSTLFNILAGDIAPSAGRILFDGADITRMPPEARARAGLARSFQVPVTFEDMSVAENVLVGAFLRHPHRRDAERETARVLAFTGLETVANLAAEARRPGIDLPRSVFAGIATVVAIYVAIAVVAVSAFPGPTTELGTTWLRAPMLGLADRIGQELPWHFGGILEVYVGLTGALILLVAITTSISGSSGNLMMG